MRYIQNLFLLLIFFIALGGALYYAFDVIDRPTWIETKAVVMSNSSYERVADLLRKYPRSRNSYVVTVNYQYHVKDRKYQSQDNIELIHNNQSFNDISRYSPGQKIRTRSDINIRRNISKPKVK